MYADFAFIAKDNLQVFNRTLPRRDLLVDLALRKISYPLREEDELRFVLVDLESPSHVPHLLFF